MSSDKKMSTPAMLATIQAMLECLSPLIIEVKDAASESQAPSESTQELLAIACEIILHALDSLDGEIPLESARWAFNSMRFCHMVLRLTGKLRSYDDPLEELKTIVDDYQRKN